MNQRNRIYEQPMNETTRVCLRLEQLFQQIDHLIDDTTTVGTRNVLAAIINTLNVLDRPDFKTKLAKELNLYVANLLRLENSPEIDQVKLREVLNQLEDLVHSFINSSGKIGQNLRDIELLNNLRLHLSNPGGGCSFDIPVYHYWLAQPIAERHATINNWLPEFKKIRTAVNLFLKLTRESASAQQKTAEYGYYDEPLDPQLNLRLIRVAIPYEMQVYPEISVGRHRLSVRFCSPNINVRAVQYTQNLSFILSCC